MLDAYQKIVYQKFAKTSWLSNQKNYERLIEWTTFYRRNMPVFVEHYLKIPLHWYQILWIYMLNMHITTVIIAGRASAKSFVIAIFSCAKCILYPNTKVVIASGNKKQASLIVKEKIEKELRPKSETLRREIKTIKTNQNDIEVIFHNGSSIVVVVGGEGALGYRSTMIIYEEFKRISKYVVDKVLKPFQMARPSQFRTNEECEQYGVTYKGNTDLLEEAANVFISSAAPTSHWMGKLLTDAVSSKYSDGASCMLATDYSIALKHEIKTFAQLREAKRTTDPITWREEYENEMLREGVDAYFTYQLLTSNQTGRKAFYPRKHEDARLKHKNPYAIPKQPGEIRIIAVDMAFIERANKNDNSCFTCIRALPQSTQYNSQNADGHVIEIQNGYRRIVPYLEASPGSDVDKQAIRIKQLYYDFEADYVVLDTRNGGLMCYDRLAKVLYDEERDCEYPAWKCINDEDIAKRVSVEGADENLFAINANPKINHTIAVTMRGILSTKMMELLVDIEDVQDSMQQNIEEYRNATDITYIDFYERPFNETKALIKEMMELKYTKNEQTGTITLYEVGSNTKDRYISVAYGNYFISLLEQDLLNNNQSEYEFDFDDEDNY